MRNHQTPSRSNWPQPDDLQRLPHTVYAAVEDEARSVLNGGRATLKRSTINGDSLIVLEPQEPLAAPLEVSIDTKHLATCFPGRNGMTYEVFSKNIAEIEVEIRGLAKAVVKGSYSERVNDSGRRTKIVARWQVGLVTEGASLNVLRPPRVDVRGWRTVTYRPY